MDILSSSGNILSSVPVDIDRVSSIDFPLAPFISSNTAPADRSGSIRLTYKYPYDGALQAELSIRDDSVGKGVTIVGRPSYRGSERTAYLAVHVPTPDTYLDVAFANPTTSAATVQVAMSQPGGWLAVTSIVLAPKASQKIRINSEALNDPTALSSTRVALLKADYSVTTTELVSNAWLVDETTGFSNTALLHDDYPNTNTLFGTQLVSGTFPETVLPKGPSFDSWLVFVNINDSPVSLSGTLYCDTGAGTQATPIPALQLLPYSPQTLSL